MACAPSNAEFAGHAEPNPATALLFIVNAASGHHDRQHTRVAIEAALAVAGITGESRFTRWASCREGREGREGRAISLPARTVFPSKEAAEAIRVLWQAKPVQVQVQVGLVGLVGLARSDTPTGSSLKVGRVLFVEAN